MQSLIGKTFKNQYFLRDLMDDSGGMADLYIAWDKERSVRMAVKVLRQELAEDEHFLTLFEREAELLRSLTHPHIVRLYEFNREGEIVYIVMDWIDGSNLRKAIRERNAPFSLKEVSEILEPICSALEYAHKKEVFHCDVKPANILLHSNGRVYLTDFGIARLAAEQRRAEGTPPYMAPEQFEGGHVDARTDIYALGVTIFEMLSGGNLPYRGEHPSSKGTTQRERIAWEHLHAPVPPLKLYNHRVPQLVEEVIQKTLQKAPSQRFESVMDLRAAFEQARSFAPEEIDWGDTIIRTIVDRIPLPNLPPIKNPFPPAVSLPARAPPPPSRKQTTIKGPHLFGRTDIWTGRAIPIPSGNITLGRSHHNHVQLQEGSISRTHATILRTRRGVYLRDENSSVGTFVNGRRVYNNRPIQLRPGDVIRIGHYLEFEYRKP